MKDKHITRDALGDLLTDRGTWTVVYTSGVFDILHAGHVDYLEKAKALGDVLVVGVNGDASVRALKGPSRPINSAEQRATVVAGLASVDYVFIFDEMNNNENIRVLKPAVYVKAGDYSKDKLSSAATVESYGGRVEFVPFLEGYSSSSIVERIEDSFMASLCHYEKQPQRQPRPAVFIDRDGTICEFVEYLHEPEKFRFLPNAIEGMKKFQDLGFSLIVVTNQPGIGLGYFTKEDFFRVSKRMLQGLSKHGVMVDKIYFSPYSKAEKTECRKPGTALIERACAEMPIDLTHSFVVGDMTSDIQLAKNAGCFSILVKTGQGGADGLYEAPADITAIDILDGARRGEQFLRERGFVLPARP